MKKFKTLWLTLAIAFALDRPILAADGMQPAPPDAQARMEQAVTRIEVALGLFDGDGQWEFIKKIYTVLQDRQRLIPPSYWRSIGAPIDNNPLAVAYDALELAVNNPDTTEPELKTKLAAVRNERLKAEANLKTDSQALRKVLSMKDEAILVNLGVLD